MKLLCSGLAKTCHRLTLGKALGIFSLFGFVGFFGEDRGKLF